MSTPSPTAPQATPWEEAYLRFETPRQEVRKFLGRLRKLGAARWPRQSHIVELFSGRGSGLAALDRLGFANIEGVDLSQALVAGHTGPGKVTLGDCRQLPYQAASFDIAIVQGGLHHLPRLPEDLEQCLREASRILRPDGHLVVVEPWQTLYLRCVHILSANPIARFISPSIDAFQIMFEHEQKTYCNWLGRSQEILALFDRYFVARHRQVRWGKLWFVGSKR